MQWATPMNNSRTSFQHTHHSLAVGPTRVTRRINIRGCLARSVLGDRQQGWRGAHGASLLQLPQLGDQQALKLRMQKMAMPISEQLPAAVFPGRFAWCPLLQAQMP